MRKLFSLEELEVDKLHRQEQAAKRSSEYDTLYNDTRTQIETDKKVERAKVEDGGDGSTDDDENDQEPSSDDPSDETDVNDDAEPTDDKSEEGDKTSNKTSDEEGDSKDRDKKDPKETEEDVSKETKEALESFTASYRECARLLIATEDIFTKENAIDAVKYVGGKTADGLGYITDLGFQYGPALLKHVYKGILYALEKSLKGLATGSIALAKYIHKRINSFKNIKAKIKSLKDTIELVEDPKTEDISRFSNSEIISKLKIGNSVNFVNNFKTVIDLCDSFFGEAIGKSVSSVQGIKHIIGLVANHSSSTTSPNSFLKDNIKFKGFVKKTLEGYEPPNELVDSFCYDMVLPGDMCFAGYMPKEQLSGESELIAAYQASSMFMAINQKTVSGISDCEFIEFNKLSEFLDLMDELCDIGLQCEGQYDKLISARDSLKGEFKGYMKVLLTLQNKISIKESMSNLIAAKTSFMDTTYIAGTIVLQDYMVKLLMSSLTYVKYGFEAYKK